MPEKSLLEPDRAIGLFRQQLGKDIENLPFDDPQVYRWWSTTEAVVREAFVPSHPNVTEFSWTFKAAYTRQQNQQEHLEKIRNGKALLEGYIEQLELLAPRKPTVAVSIDREGVYFAGQQFDAMLRVAKILSSAKRSVTIIDGYISEDVLALLASKSPAIAACILTKPLPPSLIPVAKAFLQQHGGLSIRSSAAFHDRFIIVDDSDFYHFGASIKDLGKRGFMFSRIEEPDVIEAVRTKFSHEWGIAQVEV